MHALIMRIRLTSKWTRAYVPPWTQIKEQELPEVKPEEQEITEIKAEQKPKVPSPPPTAAFAMSCSTFIGPYSHPPLLSPILHPGLTLAPQLASVSHLRPSNQTF